MYTYETIFITSPSLAEDVERSTVDTLTAIVIDAGGTIHAQDRMGRRRLAYPIRKFDDGVYTRLLYDSGIEVPKELERRVNISDHVLRALTVRLEEEWAVSAKEQAVRDAERRAEAEAQAKIDAENKAKEEAEAAEKAAAAPEPDAEEAAATETAEAAPAETAPAEAAPAEAAPAEAAPDETAEPESEDKA